MPMIGKYKAEWLPNGYIRVRDTESGLVGLFTSRGQHHSGDLCHAPAASLARCLDQHGWHHDIGM